MRTIGYRVSHINGVPFLTTATAMDVQEDKDVVVVIHGERMRADAALRHGILKATIPEAVSDFRRRMEVAVSRPRASKLPGDVLAACETALRWLPDMERIWSDIAVDVWENRMGIT